MSNTPLLNGKLASASNAGETNVLPLKRSSLQPFIAVGSGGNRRDRSLLARFLTILEHILGQNHSGTKTAHANYISLLRMMRRDAEAERLEAGL